MLDFQLTPEQIELRDNARQFAIAEILPVAWHYDHLDETPVHILRKAYEAGFTNTDVPKQYGEKDLDSSSRPL